MLNDLFDLNNFRMVLMREGIRYESDNIRYLFEGIEHCAKTAGVKGYGALISLQC